MDIPSWISAIAAVISTGVAIFIAVNTKKEIIKVTPDFVVVSSEGKVLKNSGGEISILVSLNDENFEKCKYPVPVYSLSFSKAPEYFEVTTMEGATVDLKQVDTKKYKVIFISSGFGSPIVKRNFKVQIF
jgi:hypothetical protein